jgi:CheY-like chemotaxis protein
VTRQLLTLSRKQVIEPRPIDLNAIIADTRKALTRLIGEDIDVKTAPGRDLWLVKLDPSQVDQILMNLAVNARDAMPKGGELTFETENVSLDEEYCRLHAGFCAGDYVVLSVSDNGKGMDKETAAHIFEPFFTTKEPGQGTGLGLATVYGIVVQNEGMVHLHSEPGRGTMFKLYFPRDLAAKTPSDRREEPAPALPGGTVLLVEDEATVRSVTAAMLRSLGFTVVSAASPTAALETFRRGGASVDIVLSDVVMPGMSGKELRDRLRALGPDIPVVLMSGYAANFIAHHGVLEEGVDFLQKPFDLKTLARRLYAALKGAQ